MQTEVEVGGATPALDPDADFFTTATVAVPPAVPDAHFGTIEAVYLTPIENEAWPAQFVIKVKSTNDPSLEAEYKMILPKAFYENPLVDANDLGGESQATSFRIAVSNSDGTAVLQKLRGLAKTLGRTSQTVEGLTKNPATIEEFVNNHALLFTGLEIAFYRNVNSKAEPAFRNKLEVKGIMSREDAVTAKFLNKGGYVKMFEQ